MKKLLLFLTPILAVLVIAGIVLQPAPAHASGSFNQNDVIDDGHFNNTGTMNNPTQIDTWLNTNFPSSCISSNHGFTAADPSGYSPSNGFTYGNYVSAGQVIYDAAQAYGLNPEVLLVTLQKEQSLVDGSDGCSVLRYAGAMGYGCPDGGSTYDWSPNPALYAINGVAVSSVSGTCVNSVTEAGFSQQVIHAAWLLKFGQQRSEGNTAWNVQKTNSPEPGDVWNNSDDPQTCYGGPMTQGTFKRCSTDSNPVYYDGSYTIDGTTIEIQNGATAALYWYTPHFAGNQNFDTIYNSWFGPPTGVDYSWAYQGITFSSGSSNVIGNSQVTITITAQNTGNQSWSNTNFPVRLATFAPTNHQSALYDSSWVAPARPATLNEASVAPGQDGTFTFKANIPNTTEFYQERFNLAAEGATWFPDIGFAIQLNITQANYAWQMVSQSSTAGFTLNSGETSTFTLVAKNTGNVIWNNSTNPVRLATWNPSYRISAFNDGSWPSAARAATLQQSTVAPGQNGTFVFNIRAPSTSGFYAERFNLVMEGVSWFTDPWLEFDVTVGNFYTWQMVSQSSSSGWSLSPGQTSTLTLVAKNTGNVTWNNSTNPVRLATWNPPYRTSAFDDGSWVSPYRAATLTQSSVAPGQTGTFVFTIKAPKAGFYAERFNLVMEGVSWFTDPWMEFDLTVT